MDPCVKKLDFLPDEKHSSSSVMASTSNHTISSYQCPITFDFDPTNITYLPASVVRTLTFSVAINAVLSPLTVLINFLVIWTVLEKEQLRSDNYYFVVAMLSLSDLLVGLVAQPLGVALGVCLLVRCSALCEIILALAIPAVLCRSWTAVSMAIISIERYLFIEHPLYYHTTVTSKKLMVVTAVSWLVVGTAVPVSRFLADNSSWRQLPFILTIAPSIVITLFCVSKVNLTARRQMRAIAAIQQAVATQQSKIKEYKRTFTLGLIILASVACLCPILILKIVASVKGNRSNDFKYLSQAIFMTCLNIQSIINPIIYSFRLSDIRSGVAKRLCCYRQVSYF